jgi:hypothetical protein
MRMSNICALPGICEGINAHAITTVIALIYLRCESILTTPKDSELPFAFQGIDRQE